MIKKGNVGYIGNPEKASAAAKRAQDMATVLLGDEGCGVAIVLVSYAKPGDTERDVHFAHGVGMNKNAAMSMVLVPSALRELADTLDRWIKDPSKAP